MELQNVLLCPALKVNLVSVPKLMERGRNIYFESDGCTVWKGKMKVLSATQKHGLYIINSRHEQVLSAMEWHRKFAHFGQMEKLPNTVVGLQKHLQMTTSRSETCIEAKQTKASIPKQNVEKTAQVG